MSRASDLDWDGVRAYNSPNGVSERLEREASELRADIASLRAELTEAKFLLETYPYALGYDRGKEFHREELDRLHAAARQDAEKIGRYEAEHTRLGQLIVARAIAYVARDRQDAEEKARLKEALERLVAKLTAVEADESFKGIWGLLHAHGYRYSGPDWHDELADARAALACRPQGEKS